MNQPTIADKKPIKVELVKDKKYAFCTCGESAKQPFCDGAHKKDAVFSPKIFSVDEDMVKSMCMCKMSKLGEFCDGSHKALKTEESVND